MLSSICVLIGNFLGFFGLPSFAFTAGVSRSVSLPLPFRLFEAAVVGLSSSGSVNNPPSSFSFDRLELVVPLKPAISSFL